MTKGEHSISRLAAVRRVVLPNPELAHFRVQIKQDAEMILGGHGHTKVTKSVSLEQQLMPGYQPDYDYVRQLNARVFALESLEVVLFERRALAGNYTNGLLLRAYERLTAPKIHTGRSRRTMTGQRQSVPIQNNLPVELQKIQDEAMFDWDVLPVTSSNVVRTSAVDSAEQCYALQIDGPSVFANVLLDQQKKLNIETRRIQATKVLTADQGFSVDADPLTIPFARVPFGRNREIEQFEAVIDSHPSVALELEPTEWVLELGTRRTV